MRIAGVADFQNPIRNTLVAPRISSQQTPGRVITHGHMHVRMHSGQNLFNLTPMPDISGQNGGTRRSLQRALVEFAAVILR